jgi:hypothetical protein
MPVRLGEAKRNGDDLRIDILGETMRSGNASRVWRNGVINGKHA